MQVQRKEGTSELSEKITLASTEVRNKGTGQVESVGAIAMWSEWWSCDDLGL